VVAIVIVQLVVAAIEHVPPVVLTAICCIAETATGTVPKLIPIVPERFAF
jgi:hypothetical protein